MDTNFVLIFFVMVFCIFNAYQCKKMGYNDWFNILMVIMGITGFGVWLWKDYAGYVGLNILLLFFIAPTLGLRYMVNLAMQNRIKAAAALAQGLYFLHPVENWKRNARFYSMVSNAYDPSDTELLMMNPGDSYAQRSLLIQLHRNACNWNVTRDWIEDVLGVYNIDYDDNLRLIYLRALAETGKMDLFAHYSLEDTVDLENLKYRVYECLLFYAFSGRVEMANEIIDKYLKDHPQDYRSYWRAVAEHFNPDSQQSSDVVFKNLLTSDEANVRNAARWRLMRHEDEKEMDVQRIYPERYLNFHNELNYNEIKKYPFSRVAVATYGLAIINILVFIAQLISRSMPNAPGGDHLIYLGSLSLPDTVFLNQYWKTFTAMFLHGNNLHLIMNVMGMIVIGVLVEERYGALRMLQGYLISGLLAIGTIIFVSLSEFSHVFAKDLIDNKVFSIHEIIDGQIFLGASGCVFGLLGMLGAHHYAEWIHKQSYKSLKMLKMVVFMVAIQTVFDYSTVLYARMTGGGMQTSFLAHFAGFVFGFYIGLFMLKVERNQHLQADQE